ncbi:MAG TPA: type II toxin-antitoxin system VapC family toxin [Gemmatimonadaceae bacterium]
MGGGLKNSRGPEVYKPKDLATYSGPLLLDTHIWLWYLDSDSDRLSQSVLDLLENCGRRGGLTVSDISFWEIAVKVAKGKLSLSVDVGVWLSRAATAPGFRFIPLDRDTLLLSARLSGTAHNDPVDRMLLAIAQLNNIPLVTADQRIIDYAKANRGTPVVDARG